MTRARRRPPEPEPAPESVIAEAARRLVSTVSQVVPAEALLHLLNAQRELLLAVSTVVSHNMSRTPGAGGSEDGARPRPSKVEID